MKIRFAKNLFGETVTGDIAEATQPFYQLYGEVRVETVPGSGIFLTTRQLALDPAADLTARFILNSGFRGYFQNPHFNPWSVKTLQKVTYNILKGKFYEGVVYGDPPAVQGTPTLVDDYLVINGGAAERVGDEAVLDHLLTQKKFLSWHPEVKLISIHQPDLLHFLVMESGITTLNLRAVITYTDGSTQTLTLNTLTGVSQYDLIRIPAGVPNLGLASVDFTKVINFYELFLTNQSGTKVSESRFYEVDQYEQPWERFWMYDNALGMPEVFRTVGKSKHATALAPLSSMTSILEGQDVKSSQFITREVSLREEQEVSTGYLRDLDTARYLVDFLSQRGSFFELKNGDYFPMRLSTPSIVETDTDGEYSYFVRFRVSGAFVSTSFTPNL